MNHSKQMSSERSFEKSCKQNQINNRYHNRQLAQIISDAQDQQNDQNIDYKDRSVNIDIQIQNLRHLSKIIKQKTTIQDQEEQTIIQQIPNKIPRPQSKRIQTIQKLYALSRPSAPIKLQTLIPNYKKEFILKHDRSYTNTQIDQQVSNKIPVAIIKQKIFIDVLNQFRTPGGKKKEPLSEEQFKVSQPIPIIQFPDSMRNNFFNAKGTSQHFQEKLKLNSSQQKIKRNSRTQSFNQKDTEAKSSIPVISAESWAVFDGQSGDQIFGFNDKFQRQIASITKLMTCWVVLQLSWRLNLNMQNNHFLVTKEASSILGTSAGLIEGESITVEDLLYALMLPSGNDAALTLAENFSLMMINKNIHDEWGISIENRTARFVKEMNRWAGVFQMTDTKFTNPHGLGNHLNVSTAADVGKLCSIVTKDPFMQDIVKREKYQCTSYDRYGLGQHNNKIMDKYQQVALNEQILWNKNWSDYKSGTLFNISVQG